MRIIYLDSEYRCFIDPEENLTPIETDIFDDRSPAYIQSSRYIPKGKKWIRSDGEIFTGPMVSLWKNYDIANEANYEIESLKQQLAILKSKIK